MGPKVTTATATMTTTMMNDERQTTNEDADAVAATTGAPSAAAPTAAAPHLSIGWGCHCGSLGACAPDRERAAVELCLRLGAVGPIAVAPEDRLHLAEVVDRGLDLRQVIVPACLQQQRLLPRHRLGEARRRRTPGAAMAGRTRLGREHHARAHARTRVHCGLSRCDRLV